MEELAETKKSMCWPLASSWCLEKGTEWAGAAGTWEMTRSWLHPSCAGKQGEDEHWDAPPRYPTAFTILSA